MAAREWDGAAYDRISQPLERNGLTVLDRLWLRGDETVIDAGCGSGRVTQALVSRLPRGRVIGVDASAGMLAAARRRLGQQVELRRCDLTELELAGERADAVFSTAVFHWIADHERLFWKLRAALIPGGRLVAQCGGEGNSPELLDATLTVGASPPYRVYLDGFDPWNFAGPAITAERLREAGFSDVRTALVERPPPYDDLRQWLRTNALGAHLIRLPRSLRASYLDAVQAAFGPRPKLTYIRLDIDAVASLQTATNSSLVSAANTPAAAMKRSLQPADE